MIRVEGLVKKGHNMTMKTLNINKKKLVNGANKALNAGAVVGIELMAGTAGGVTGAFVGGVAEGAINTLLPNAPQPLKTVVAVGSTALGFCSGVATATIIQGKLLESYADALETRDTSLALINGAYQE
nr:MAG TPA: Microcin V bacteriocin [Caudoviricetes sp.]